jgi:hypothetical protein
MPPRQLKDVPGPHQVILWERWRPARKRAAGAHVYSEWRNSFSRFALIAGGTPAVPANHLIGPTAVCNGASAGCPRCLDLDATMAILFSAGTVLNQFQSTSVPK